MYHDANYIILWEFYPRISATNAHTLRNLTNSRHEPVVPSKGGIFLFHQEKERERERGEDKQAFKTVFHFPLINFPRKYFPVGFHSKEKKVIIIITKTIASKILKTLLVILSFLLKKSVIDQKRNINSWRMFRDEEDRSMTINSKNRLMSPRVKKLINYSFIQVYHLWAQNLRVGKLINSKHGGLKIGRTFLIEFRDNPSQLSQLLQLLCYLLRSFYSSIRGTIPVE